MTMMWETPLRLTFPVFAAVMFTILAGCVTTQVTLPTKASYEMLWRSDDPEVQARVERAHARFEVMRFNTFDMRGKTIVDAMDLMKEEMRRQGFTVNMTLKLRSHQTDTVPAENDPFAVESAGCAIFDFVLKNVSMVEVLNTICEKDNMVWGLAPWIWIVPKEEREYLEKMWQNREM